VYCIVLEGLNCVGKTMYCDCGKNWAFAGEGMAGCGKGSVVIEPTDHGLPKLIGPEVAVCVWLIAVA
jgi:hypothetical protein